mmetsp:Transcript_52545/g.60097  ORF Transcript_52545/g.60097 Transcript_52545/m.60097 type:complete len:105 (-) Transcript_52545:64-378(-)
MSKRDKFAFEAFPWLAVPLVDDPVCPFFLSFVVFLSRVDTELLVLTRKLISEVLEAVAPEVAVARLPDAVGLSVDFAFARALDDPNLGDTRELESVREDRLGLE